jgi:hypothetical protein
VAALDSVTLIGLNRADEQVARAAAWLIEHQEADGLWPLYYARPDARETEAAKKRETRLWVALAICRVMKRLSR